MGWDSTVGIATRYGLDGPEIESQWGARFSAPVQTGPGAYSASLTMGTGSFPEVKRPGHGADHPPPSKCRGHERVGLYLYSPSGPLWPVIGRTLPAISWLEMWSITNVKWNHNKTVFWDSWEVPLTYSSFSNGHYPWILTVPPLNKAQLWKWQQASDSFIKTSLTVLSTTVIVRFLHQICTNNLHSGLKSLNMLFCYFS